MNDPSIPRVSERDEAAIPKPVINGADHDEDASAAQLRELQKLLFDSDRKAELDELRAQWNDPEELTPRVSRVLPDAIARRTSEDNQLTEAMAPYVVESIRVSVRRHPEHISDAIFPILGPAIRKAVAQAIANLTQTINQTLQHSFSVRGMQWRLEAVRSGKSFAEIVLYHSLVFRVEQVLLIHHPTGLVLAHVFGEAVKAQEPELISGMLTAIRDFIQDSFGGSEEADAEFYYDDLRVLTVRGPRASLACAVRGVPPSELKEEMQETIEYIHQQRGDKLKSFDGDATPFEGCRPRLEALLKTRYQAFADPAQQRLPKVAWAMLGLLLLALGLWMGLLLRDQWRWNSYLNKLRATPGLVLTEANRGWRKYSLGGLRDPLAADPRQLMTEFQLDPARVSAQWKEYQAPELAEARAKKLLQPPPGVTLQVRDGILSASGAVSQQWFAEAKKLAPFIPGIVQMRGDEAGEVATLQQEIEALQVRFAENEPIPLSDQNEVMTALARKIVRLDELAQRSEQPVRLRIIGHTDASGRKENNEALSQERAQHIRQQLAARTGPLKNTKLTTEGRGDQQPLGNNPEANRRVSFQIER